MDKNIGTHLVGDSLAGLVLVDHLGLLADLRGEVLLGQVLK